MKGSFGDLFYLMIILVVVVITAVVCFLVVNVLEDEGFYDLINVSGVDIKATMDTSFEILDYGIPFSFVLSCLFITIAVYFIRSHPIFFVASMLIMVVVIFVTAPIVNMVVNVLSADELVAYSNQFPITVAFVQNLPVIVLMFGIMIAISLYAKPGESNV